MQAEENAVELTTLDRGDNRIAKPLERRALYPAAGPGRGAEDMFDLPAVPPTNVEKTGQLGIGLASRGGGLVADQNVTVPERLFAGEQATEGVGLVRELGGEDPKCHERAARRSALQLTRDNAIGRRAGETVSSSGSSGGRARRCP